jgi:hypothetical protein
MCNEDMVGRYERPGSHAFGGTVLRMSPFAGIASLIPLRAIARKFGDVLLRACQKSPGRSLCVIPAEAGIQVLQGFLDPGFRRGDGIGVLI